MGNAHDSTMPWPPSPITARKTSRPRRTTANSALRHTAHHGLPMATRIVSWTTNTVHPADDATNSTTPTQNGQLPRGRVPDVGQQEHVDQRDDRTERHDQHQGGPDRLAGEPSGRRDPAQGADADVELADPGDEDERRDDLGGLTHLGGIEEPRREDPAEQPCERAHARADRERQAVVQPVGPPRARGLGGRRPHLHWATTACRSRNGTLTAVRTYSAVAGCQ